MEHFVRQRPNFAAIAQFSGGEPTLHPRIIDLLKKAKELGFPHRMLNTNGIRMAKDIEFCKQVKEADCGAIYLSFDGLEPETHKKIRGMDLTKIKQKFIENCRTVGIDGIMLVITLAKGINDHEVPAILNYVKENNDVIAGVVFQPVSLCGRIGLEDLMNLRYTNSDLLPEIRKATNDGIKEFYPLGMHNKLTSLITWFGDQPMWAVSAHDDCGFATLAQVTPDGTWHGIEEYMEIEGLVKWANQVWDMVCKREIPKPSKLIESVKAPLLRLGFEPLLDALGSFTDKMTDFAYRQAMKAYFVAGAAKYFKKEHLKDVMSDRFYKNIFQLLLDPTLRSSKGMLLNGLIFIGSMHFQDAYNMDVARVQRCVVHYGVLNPDDPQDVLQIPFCTFNTIHRERIEKQWALNHSSPLDKSPEQHAKEVQALEDSIAAEKRAK